ncbi:MAG: AarF/ABC1/UbiB kinase family protein [Myxococcales bacterium]|nr:MAG: AarF/ABC1/UbiB kinase family protein [Myxococcales bacterium]
MKINQTFKNLKRVQRIGAVFASHGFKSVMDDIGLGRLIPFQTPREGTKKLSNAVRLRMAFEELGTTFVKLGQMLSVRPDLIPREYVEEFRKLQDQVAPLPVEDIRAEIRKEFDLAPEQIFDWFDASPIGSASIAQVHRARLPDGREMVVKVRRPGADKQVETDLSILFMIAAMLDHYTDLVTVVDPVAIVEEFASLIRAELDFIHEAQNIKRFAENFAGDEHVIVPEVAWEFTGKSVLTMSYLDGIPLSDAKRLDEKGYDKRTLARLGLDTFFKMVFTHGLFHGDVHGGNLLVMGPDKLGVIDFGVAGSLDDRLMQEVGSIFISLVSRDFRALARHYLRLGHTSREPVSPEVFARDLQRVIEPLMGLPLKEINSAELMMALAGVAQRHRVQLPPQLLLLFRAAVTLDGVGRELDPDFDVLSAASGYAKAVVIERYKPERLFVDFVTVMRDLTDLGRDMPSQLHGILKRAEEGGLVVDARLHDKTLLATIRREGWKRVAAILTGAGAVTLGIVHTSDSFGFAGLVGLMLLFAGLGGLIAAPLIQGRKG